MTGRLPTCVAERRRSAGLEPLSRVQSVYVNGHYRTQIHSQRREVPNTHAGHKPHINRASSATASH